MFLVFSTTPTTKPTGEITIRRSGDDLVWHKIVDWRVLGRIDAKSAEHALMLAKQRWGGSPVIEEVSGPH